MKNAPTKQNKAQELAREVIRKLCNKSLSDPVRDYATYRNHRKIIII
jgi:hypothetical protein